MLRIVERAYRSVHIHLSWWVRDAYKITFFLSFIARTWARNNGQRWLCDIGVGYERWVPGMILTRR